MDIIFPLLSGVEGVGSEDYACRMKSLFIEEELEEITVVEEDPVWVEDIVVDWVVEEDPVDWVVEDVEVVVTGLGAGVVVDVVTGLSEINSPVKTRVIADETEDWI